MGRLCSRTAKVVWPAGFCTLKRADYTSVPSPNNKHSICSSLVVANRSPYRIPHKPNCLCCSFLYWIESAFAAVDCYSNYLVVFPLLSPLSGTRLKYTQSTSSVKYSVHLLSPLCLIKLAFCLEIPVSALPII